MYTMGGLSVADGMEKGRGVRVERELTHDWKTGRDDADAGLDTGPYEDF